MELSCWLISKMCVMFHVNPDLLYRLHSSSHTTLYYCVYTVAPSIINVSLVVKFLLDDEYLVIPFSVCLIFFWLH